MNTQEFINFIPSFIDKLTKDGMSQSIIDNNKWIIDSFVKYCNAHKISEIDMTVIKKFYEQQYNMDIYNLNSPLQTTIRRPLLIFMEYYQNGNYFKTHQKSKQLSVPLNYSEVFKLFQEEFVNNLNIVEKSKRRKLWVMANFFEYLDSNGVNNINDLKISNVSNYTLYLESHKKYASETMRIQRTVLRESLDWFYKNNIITFSGRQAFPLIRRDSRGILLSTYTNDEIKQLLNIINIDNRYGKCVYSILTILAYLGLRAGDIINLKFEHIDFNNNEIKFYQNKTKQLLTLPLIDEVKYPLLDYIKNGRPKCEEKEYIFITLYAPFTRFKATSSIFRMVEGAMKKAGINYANKHHGPHAIRHSLATNMINNNVPISAISQILGHNNIRTTEIYITKDTTHLRELTLEVPNEKR
ncbi:MAG: site-specific integrase [Bacilli bacterium]